MPSAVEIRVGSPPGEPGGESIINRLKVLLVVWGPGETIPGASSSLKPKGEMPLGASVLADNTAYF